MLFLKSPRYLLFNISFSLLFLIVFQSCSSNSNENKEEQIRISDTELTDNLQDTVNSVQGNISLSQIASTPQSILLTGLAEHRLVTIYKSKPDKIRSEERSGSLKFYSESEVYEIDKIEHYMPGLDLLFGYNLLNVADYNLKMEKLTFLIDHPVLIKSLYYPSFVQDSLNKKPINRAYNLLSVYDEDTNKDTLLNKKDLRRFYHFEPDGNVKIQLIPPDYSVVRSQYDDKNDLMYIFAKHDSNKNGKVDKNEPMQIFWIDLKLPAKAKRLY